MTLDDLDKHISIVTESVARALSRRTVLARATKGLVATIAGVTLGELMNVREAFAVSCNCHPANGTYCSNCPNGVGCPSGCSACTGTDYCGGWCTWDHGWWLSCSGLGSCGNGYRICTDCKCPNCGSNNTSVCTCLSAIICQNCCTREQVAAEARRLAAMYG